jgi:putative spermidine/putrescine transport system substrate-binding protein
MASWIPYGPARKSAVPLVGSNPDLKIDMAPYLPTAHFDTAFATDENWWRQHGGEVATRWENFAR